MDSVNVRFMQRCLALAEMGRASVPPNPMVGCVIVYQGQIIAEGYHQQYAQAHAEVNAIAAVKDIAILKKAELYVNLEPCSHYGKTPPCADLIIKMGIPKVFVANLDPNPEVNGQGIAKLRQAGVEVYTGLLADQGERLNARFFTFIRLKRPYIILKWAQSLDGFIDHPCQHQITNAPLKALVHRWRSEEPAIMVGTQTVIADNPQLNVRCVHGRNPLRIIPNINGRLDMSYKVFDATQPTLVFGQAPKGLGADSSIEVVPVSDYEALLPILLDTLYQRKISSILVEGGTVLIHRFIEMQLFDEVRILIGNCWLGSGVAAPQMRRPAHESHCFGDQHYLRFFNHE